MGNSSTQKASFVLDANSLNDWTKVEEQGFCELWMHKKTNQQLQAYPIPESFARNEDQLSKYHLRKNNNHNLVSVQAIVTPADGLLCSQPRTAYALVENVTCRLRNYRGSLTFPQALYVLSAAASGYNTLNSFFGPIDPHPDMICFNQEGKVKVWLNQNLSLNEPSLTARASYVPSEDYNLAQKRTKEGVNKLVKMVEMSCGGGFPGDILEQFNRTSTYFEIENLVPYYCEKKGIELPGQILIRPRLENPVFQPRRELVKEQSMPILPQSAHQLDVSRVRTVAVGSSQIIQQISQPRTIERRWTENDPFKRQRPSIQGFQNSPKITFNIRTSLPNPIKNEQSPIKAIIREAGLPRCIPRRLNEVYITPPQQHVVMERVERKSSKSEKGSMITETKGVQNGDKNCESNQNQNTVKVNIEERNDQKKHVVQLTFTKIQKFSNIQENKSREQPIQLVMKENKTVQQTNIEDISNFLPQEVISRQEIAQEHYLQDQTERNKSMDHEVIPISEPTSSQDIPQSPQFRQVNKQIFQGQQYQFYSQEQHSQRILTSELQMPSYKNSEKNIEVDNFIREQPQQVQEVPEKIQELQYKIQPLNLIEDGDNSKRSSLSHAEPYIPPAYFNMNSPIIEQQDENFSSPRKQNSQIEQWEAKLNKFTSSRHQENTERTLTIVENVNEQQKKSLLRPIQVKNEKIYDYKPEAVNELHNLGEEDIESYIRAKYNLGKKENTARGNLEKITKIESIYQKAPEIDYQNNCITDFNTIYNNVCSYDYKSNNYTSDFKSKDYSSDYKYVAGYKENDYTSGYKSYDPLEYKNSSSYDDYKINYKAQYQFDNHSKYDTIPSYAFNQNKNSYDFTFKKYPEKSSEQLEKQNYLPLYKVESQSDNVSIQLYDTTKRKDKPKQSIEERYNKYVVNGARRNSNHPGVSHLSNQKDISRISNPKDISLLLTQERDISGISPGRIPSELNESSKRGIRDLIVERPGVTYQKLRTLLWED